MEAEACSNNVPLGKDTATPSLTPRGGQPAIVDDEALPRTLGPCPQPQT